MTIKHKGTNNYFCNKNVFKFFPMQIEGMINF
jgi:hypothetical protein